MADGETRAPRWTRRLAMPAVLVLGIGLGVGLFQGNQVYIAASNPTSCAAACVTAGSPPLSTNVPGTASIVGRIEKANETATASGHYASVVLMDPFTYTPGGSVSRARIADELRGAYLAQQAANAGTGIPVQLLLANEGISAEEGEAQAVRQIESLEGPDHIVAVAGMGLSDARTEDAATALAADGMPTFGAVTTGDLFNGLTYQGFYQVVPDVDTQVRRLLSILGGKNGRSVPLISSDQSTDIYSTDLLADFKTAFSQQRLQYYSFDPATAMQEFATIATTICGRPRDVPYVLYGGREANFPVLIEEFQQSAVCAGQQVTIVTGSDGDALPLADTKYSQNADARVTVEYSDIEDVSQVPAAFAKKYGGLLPSGLGPPAACENQRYDPWAIATYNSVMAATGALRQASAPSKAAVLTSARRLPETSKYRGAAGTFGFNLNGQIFPTDIPLYTESNGICSPVAAPAAKDSRPKP